MLNQHIWYLHLVYSLLYNDIIVGAEQQKFIYFSMIMVVVCKN